MFHTELEEDGLAPWLKAKGRGKRWYINYQLPSQSLWIERKIFYVVPLLPGRTIRMIEMLVDRRFVVEFRASEVPWIIGALREAVSAQPRSDFTKWAAIGRRSLFVSTVSNRSGVYIKLMCSLGGNNRRYLFIPAGEKGRGWSALANLLAKVSARDTSSFKKPVPPYSKLRSYVAPIPKRDSSVVAKVSFAEAVKGMARFKEKSSIVSGWKEGFLPTLLEAGLSLSIGDPSSSREASRRFAWKEVQSEIGLGTLVVELATSAVSPSLKLSSAQSGRGCRQSDTDGDVASISGDSCSIAGDSDGFGEDEEVISVPRDVNGGVSTLGNDMSPSQARFIHYGRPVRSRPDLKSGGPTGMVVSPSETPSASPTHLNSNSNLNSRAVDKMGFLPVSGPGFGTMDRTTFHSEPGRPARNEADPHPLGRVLKARKFFSLGGQSRISGLGSILAKPMVGFSSVGTRQVSGLGFPLKKASETLPFCGDDMRVGNSRGCCDFDVFFPNGSEEISQLVMPDISCGGAHLGMGDPLDYATDTYQSFFFGGDGSSGISESPVSLERLVGFQRLLGVPVCDWW